MKNITELSIFLFIFAAVISSAIFACLPAGTVLAEYYYNYNYPACNYHAYKDCVGTAIYWYDSCTSRQDLYQDCSSFGQTCRYGQCVSTYNPPVNPYTAHNKIACYENNLYWYDSLGSASGLYKNCIDTNSCTFDNCSDGKCSNELKCDGTTCAKGSADYNNYCAPANPVNPVSLSVFFSGKSGADAQQWEKTTQMGQNSTVYFMLAINNNSNSQIDNVDVLVNIPSEISFLGNLKVDNTALSGDIVSGINIGSLGAGAEKSITFEGKTQTFSAKEQKQAIATVNVPGATQSDFITLDFDPNISVSASVSSAPASSGFMGFLKRWYLWILAGIVMIFLFFVVFKRLSSNA
jgi:hypothetical protein